MAVTKRTRFEVLRRDDHTCQYCGDKVPNVTLQIDHVMPVSLGGTDTPDNLVTACKECNSGKSSISPDSHLVSGLSEKAASYALGMVDKMTRLRANVESFEEYLHSFTEVWSSWTVNGKQVELGSEHELSLYRWHSMGVPFRLVEMAVNKAMRTKGLYGDDAEFSYAAGIVWKIIKEDEIDFSVTTETAAVYTEAEADSLVVDGYEKGYGDGRARGAEEGISRVFRFMRGSDFLTHHIDGTTSPHVERMTKVGASVG